MSSPAESLEQARPAPQRTAWLDRFLRDRLMERLQGLVGGQLHIHDDLGHVVLGSATEPGALTVKLWVNRSGVLPTSRQQWLGRRWRSVHGRPVELRRPGRR